MVLIPGFGKKKEPTPQEKELAQTRNKVSMTLGRGMVDVKDIIAPPALQVEFDYIRVGDIYYRTLFESNRLNETGMGKDSFRR